MAVGHEKLSRLTIEIENTRAVSLAVRFRE